MATCAELSIAIADAKIATIVFPQPTSPWINLFIGLSDAKSFLISFNLSAADCSKPTMPSKVKWQQWLSEVKLEALSLGISKKTIDQEFKNLKMSRRNPGFASIHATSMQN